MPKKVECPCCFSVLESPGPVHTGRYRYRLDLVEEIRGFLCGCGYIISERWLLSKNTR